jgi:heptosyltransferase-2/heptosyltransferase-3
MFSAGVFQQAANPPEPMRVLVVRLDHLGDVILTTPLIRAAVKAGHEVHVLVKAACAAPLLGGPFTLHTLEAVAPAFPGRWWPLGKWMRGMRFEMILLPHARPVQLLLASALSGARRRIAMWAGIPGRLTAHQCIRSGMREGGRHFSDITLDCARAVGIPTDGLRPDFFLSPPEIENARADMASRFPGLKIVGIHPGCAGNTCNLPPQVYGQLSAKLLEDPSLAVVGTGIPSEQRLFDAFPREVLAHPRFYNACGQWTLRQLAAHIAGFTTLVVVGTGPLHIASALSIPTVNPFCCFRPISPAVWGNLTPGTIVLSPPAGFCEQRRAAAGAGHCDFQGRVTVDQLHRAVMDIVALRGGTRAGSSPR